MSAFLRQVSSFTRFPELNNVHNLRFEISALQSPNTLKFLYLEE